ncbi:BCCT family transporter [Marinibaculum pumilum]|uniref:BCCT family transporter n=1 Tax=Marinibaculum pumilum TaxID=1766165 RepID=A0ABV7L8I4_9PROT
MPRAKSNISPPVFYGSAGLILAFVIWGAAAPSSAEVVFGAVQGWIVDTFGWFYMLAVAVFVVFAIGLALSSHGRVRLGPDDSVPEYSYTAWFAMLFSAGMGIGLMFFGVAEPIMHYDSPPIGAPETVDAARQAMTITFFHWGIHAWSIYAVVALALAYFCYRHGLPLTIRSALYPLIGERIRGRIGDVVDILAVLGTMFGVATSLGLGVLQVNAGLSYLFGIEEGIGVQMVLIAVITALATLSVALGLDAGIRRLSEINLILAIVLVVFVLAAGPTLYLLQTLVQNTGTYLSNVVNMTFNLYAYQPNGWIGGWTLFYWAWWIAWSPFVGMFIARVSKGRTIREFVGGVLFVPVGFTFIWLTFFGNTALNLDMGIAQGALSAAVSENTSTALFKFLEYLPLTGIASVVATILVVTFFVTSSDSGSLVIDIITSGGSTDAPAWQRVFWAIIEGVVAAVLLLAGGLSALQTASITVALPFTVVMLFVCYGMVRGLRMEGMRRLSQEVGPPVQIHGADVPWQRRLKTIMSFPKRDRAIRYLKETAVPALQQVADEIRASGWTAEVEEPDDEHAILTVYHGEEREFLYGVHLRAYSAPTFAFPEIDMKDRGEANRYYRAEVHLLEGGQHYDVLGYTKEQLIGDILSQYEKHMHFLHIAAK